MPHEDDNVTILVLLINIMIVILVAIHVFIILIVRLTIRNGVLGKAAIIISCTSCGFRNLNSFEQFQGETLL